jgi:hypothetical protein
MNLWRIFVLGTLRLNCNRDYDKLQEIANNHRTLRQMLRHSFMDNDFNYSRQTPNDNIRWFTPEIIDKINNVIVSAGIDLQLQLNKKTTDHARCDSFVLETDVHFLTDINLLWDAVRKCMTLRHRAAEKFDISGWRQAEHNLKRD